MIYLLDSNTFIEAKNRYYSMTTCPAYWDWLDREHRNQHLKSISSVYDELENFGDALSVWVKDRKSLFMDIDDPETQNNFLKVIEILQDQIENKGMHANALGEFLKGADPWLIAKAMTLGGTVVTHEQPVINIKRRFLIPNICQELGVPYVDTFTVLDQLQASFILA